MANRASLLRAGTARKSRAAALALTACLLTTGAAAQSGSIASEPIVSRHLETARWEATQRPRSEGDQAIVDGWPLYRTPRGQTAFNDAMATLKVTDTAAPARDAFKGCVKLECALTLPSMSTDGWLPAGRIWVSPTEYVILAHSPRNRSGRYDRHAFRKMRYFVFHEFHNSSRNVDPYDTISSHRDDVFVPFYMSKARSDARGRHFVVIVQVAPYDVDSVHATNLGSAGPGVEVAKNASDDTEPLQMLAGIVLASIVKAAAPHLEVTNHRGAEGQEMLDAYDGRLERLNRRSGGQPVPLPYVAASARSVVAAAGRLDDLILRPGASPPLTIAERAALPTRPVAARSGTDPVLIEPPRLARRPVVAGGG